MSGAALCEIEGCTGVVEPYMPRLVCFEHTLSHVSQIDGIIWALNVVQALARITHAMEPRLEMRAPQSVTDDD